MKLKFRYHKRILTLAGFALALTVAFQNCGGTGMRSASSAGGDDSPYFSGNGGGYGGKTTYVKREETQSCADGKDTESVIEVSAAGEATVVRENCQDITPRPVPFVDINLMAHNTLNLIYGGGVYDVSTEPDGHTTLLCRGSADDPRTGNTWVADVLIRHNTVPGAPEWAGRVIFGVYDADGKLLQKYDMGRVPLARPETPIAGLELYVSRTAQKGESFSLGIRDYDQAVMLIYRPKKAVGGPLNESDPAHPNAYAIHKLTCYRQ